MNKNEYDERLVTGLLCNYRSLPTILNVYNDMFYNSQLIATIDGKNSKEAKYLETLCDADLIPAQQQQGVYFCNVRGKNVRYNNSYSWCNDEEVEEVNIFPFSSIIHFY